MGRKVTVTGTYSHRTLFSGRVTRRVTTTQGSADIRPQPSAAAHFSGVDPLEPQRRRQEQIDTLTAAGPANHAAMANLNAVARWLHTPLGAALLALASVVGLVLALSPLEQGVPLVLLTVALAIVDWHNLVSLHGSINWPRLHVTHPTGYWWALVGMVLCGWIGLPGIYAVQAWLAAPAVRTAERAATQARIAELERELGLPPSDASAEQ